MHQSSASRPSFWDHYFNLLMTQQPKSSCHFLVLLTFDHCIPQCSQVMTIGSGVALKLAVMTQMIHSRTSLISWKRFYSSCKPDHGLITGLVQHPLVNYILFFSPFVFSTIVTTTTGFLAFTNFTSLEIFMAKLLSPMYPNPIFSEKVF